MTRVSVITPFLNAEAHLDEAIGSVRAQTEPDWELLLVDDGSTDGSLRVAQAAAERDPRIRVLAAPADAPRGAAAARNAGIAAARGDFVAFLDADDVFEPRMLATTLRAATDHPSAGIVLGRTQWWHPDGTRRDWIEPADGRGERLFRPPELLRSLVLLQHGNVPCICSVLVRRSALADVGGFDERFHLYEDQTMWVKLFHRYDAYVTSACLSRYRQHPGSTSARASAQGLYDRMGAHAARDPFLAWVEDYLSRFPPDARLNRSLRLARAAYRDDRGLAGGIDRMTFRVLRKGWRLRRRISKKFRRIGHSTSGQSDFQT